MAIKEAQSRNRIHAVYAARETSASSELVRVVEGLNRLEEKVEMKAATNQKEVEQNLELMRKQLAQKQVQLALLVKALLHSQVPSKELRYL
jgi:Zn-dependent M16 (insulinase) family peptidase